MHYSRAARVKREAGKFATSALRPRERGGRGLREDEITYIGGFAVIILAPIAVACDWHIILT